MKYRAHTQHRKPHRQAARAPQQRGTGPRARDLVHARLTTCAERFPSLPIDVMDVPELDELDGLDTRDAALARTILRQATVRWLTLRALLKHVLHKGFDELEPTAKAGLICGATQIVLLDRVPPHAAINESVKWVGRMSGQQPSGLVNAVLRKLAGLTGTVEDRAWAGQRNAVPLSDGRTRTLAEPMLPAKQIERWATATGLTRPFLAKLEAQFDLERARAIALHAISQPPTIVRLPNDMSLDSEIASLDARLAQQVRPHLGAHFITHHAVYAGPKPELEKMLDAIPLARVQDPASSASLKLVRETMGEGYSPRVIVDLCAGKGTKTVQLAEMFPDATIYATDKDDRRFAALERMVGDRPALASRVHVRAYDDMLGDQTKLDTPISADLVLLDVPCSNSGVLARRPEARYRQQPDDLARMVALQSTIVQLGNTFRADNGILVYATCSLMKEENENMVTAMASQLGLAVKAARAILPQGPPATEWNDGSFAAILG